MRKTLISATLLLVLTMPALSHVQARYLPRDADGDGEASIYSLILNERYAADPDKSVVVVDKTFGAPDMERELNRDDLQARLSPLSQATVESYKGKNKEPLRLKGFQNVKAKYLLMTEGELKEFFEKDVLSGWESFRQKYPDAVGVVQLSRVGFNPEGTEALVSILYSCGEVCGEGSFILLTKTGSGWRIAKSVVVVIA